MGGREVNFVPSGPASQLQPWDLYKAAPLAQFESSQLLATNASFNLCLHVLARQHQSAAARARLTCSISRSSRDALLRLLLGEADLWWPASCCRVQFSSKQVANLPTLACCQIVCDQRWRVRISNIARMRPPTCKGANSRNATRCASTELPDQCLKEKLGTAIWVSVSFCADAGAGALIEFVDRETWDFRQ